MPLLKLKFIKIGWFWASIALYERDLNPRSVELAGIKPTTTPHPKRDRPPYLYLSLVSKSGLFSGRNSLRPNSGVAAASVPEGLSGFGLICKKIIFDVWPKMFCALNFFITFKVSWSGKVVKQVLLLSWHLSLGFFLKRFLASFFYFCLFYFYVQLVDNILLMLGFKLSISGVGSYRSTNWTTTTVLFRLRYGDGAKNMSGKVAY